MRKLIICSRIKVFLLVCTTTMLNGLTACNTRFQTNCNGIDGELQAGFDNNNPQQVLDALRRGANPNSSGCLDYTYQHGSPLTRAAIAGYVEVVRALIGAGAQVDSKGQVYRGYTALMKAAFHGHEEVAKILLDAGADPNIQETNGGYINVRRPDGKTALMWAVKNGHANVAELLLNRGANPNIVANYRHHDYDIGEDTALIIAAEEGHTAIVQLLLDNGADPNMQAFNSDNGITYTALKKAQEKGYTEIVRILRVCSLNCVRDRDFL